MVDITCHRHLSRIIRTKADREVVEDAVPAAAAVGAVHLDHAMPVVAVAEARLIEVVSLGRRLRPPTHVFTGTVLGRVHQSVRHCIKMKHHPLLVVDLGEDGKCLKVVGAFSRLH